MALLPAGDDAPEVTQRRSAYSADIEMDKQKHDNQESKNYVELVSQKYTAESKESLEYELGKHQGPAGNKEHRQGEVHHSHIGYLLQGVELALSVDGKRRFLSPEITEGVEPQLFPEPLNQPLQAYKIMSAVVGKYVTEEECRVTYRKKNAAHVVYGNRPLKIHNKSVLRIRVEHAESRHNKEQAQYGICKMPEPDPDRIVIEIFTHVLSSLV